MESARQPTPFSIAKDGKHHDGVFRVDGDIVSVIYWAPQGVTCVKAHAEDTAQAEQTAREILSQMI